MIEKHGSCPLEELSKNLVFAGMVYDSFEALEEALGKLKLEQPLFLTYLAKKAFAEEVFQCAEKEFNYQIRADERAETRATLQ